MLRINYTIEDIDKLKNSLITQVTSATHDGNKLIIDKIYHITYNTCLKLTTDDIDNIFNNTTSLFPELYNLIVNTPYDRLPLYINIAPEIVAWRRDILK